MNYFNIKRYCLALISVLWVHSAVLAQADNRTLQTQVADLLAQFPAPDADEYTRLMDALSELSEPGILEMSRMFTPAGDNSQLEYALGGLSFYVMQSGNSSLRSEVSSAYINALESASDDNIKAFFIRQLQIVGKQEAVPVLEKLLGSARHCSPAARALAQVNTQQAREALLAAFPQAEDDCLYALISALGKVHHTEAVEALTGLVGDKDVKTQKLALNALASIGDPSSGEILSARAEAAGYVLEQTNATPSYLLWAERMAEAGETRTVAKLAKRLLKRLDEPQQVHTRTAALGLLVEAEGEGAMRSLLSAAIDKDPEFRAAALRHALDLKGSELTTQWVRQLRKADPEAKAGIIAMLGKRNDESAYAAVAKELDSQDPAVKKAAITATAKLGGISSLPGLLAMVPSADTAVVSAIRSALLTMKGEIIQPVADALPKATSFGKAALLDVLGARKATSQSKVVLDLASQQDPMVRLSALKALENVAGKEDLPSMFSLLSSLQKETEITALQAAITEVMRSDAAAGTALITGQLEKVSPEVKPRYYAILAGIGTPKALEAVAREFRQGNKASKESAIRAMSNWKGFTAENELFAIARESAGSPYFEQALQGYIRQVSSSGRTAQDKYLLLRKAMEIARTGGQKRMVMGEIGKCATLPAFFYASNFLSDKAVQQEAGAALMNIALNNPGIYGNNVRDLLKAAIDVVEGEQVAYLIASVQTHLSKMPAGPGFTPLFNGKDLSGWKGLVGNPLIRDKMSERELSRAQKEADEAMRKSWKAEDGLLVFTGQGDNISTDKKYGDFEMFVDWKIAKEGDAGIYLRGTPQVQIWDTTRHEVGAQVGSGGLYNNQVHESKPLKVADNPVGQWNTFHITMTGERVTVYLNGELVVDSVVLENYWDRGQPIFAKDYIELQAHGTRVEYRDIYLREIPRSQPFVLSKEEEEEGFKVLFDGRNLDHWQGNTTDYIVEDGNLVVRPQPGSRGNLFTKEQYSDFVLRFDFQLTPGANNGLGIRAPLEGDAAYAGMELQILDNTADIYKNLHSYQYHGSVYGILAAKRGYLNPVGEWNTQEVIVNGPKIKVILNGEVIVEGDVEKATKNGTADGKKHPGLKREKGYIGFLGHGSVVKFKNIRIKDLSN